MSRLPAAVACALAVTTAGAPTTAGVPATAVARAAPPGRADGATADTSRVWTFDDLVKDELPSEITLSRDGRLAVWVLSTVEKVAEEDVDEERVKNLWLARLDGGLAQPLTRGLDRVSDPAFSPDGRQVAFLSNRPLPGPSPDDKPAKTQLWVIPTGGGEAFPVTRLDRDVKAFAWTGDSAFVLAAEESPSLWERERKSAKDASIAVEDSLRAPPVRLFRVRLDGGDPTRLTENADWIESLAVSPDGRSAVITAQRSLSHRFDERVPPRTALVDLRTGRESPLFEDGAIQPHDVRWAPDGSGFYLLNEFTRHPRYRQATISELHYHDLRTGETRKVDLDWDRAMGGSYAPLPDGVLVLLADGVRYRPARYRRTGRGWTRSDLAGPRVRAIDDWNVSADGRRMVYESSTATVPTQLYAARIEGNRLASARRLTDLNPRFEGKPTGRVEVLRWEGSRGDTVEGLLHYPLDWRAGEPRPLVVQIHGGPTETDRDTWNETSNWLYPILPFRARGAFVLQVNYHGSGGYGLDWAESIGNGHYYELEVPDIERGVDFVLATGLVDPDRLGITGWSNGGILAVEILTRTVRYRAASIGAADVEWFSDWANVDFGATSDNYYLGGAPYEVPQRYLEKSPFFRLDGVTTPTLVLAGTADRSVPVGQSWSLFRALQQIGRAPTRLVLFPDEPHVPKAVAFRLRKLEEEMAWFDRYLFGVAPPAPEGLKPGSPLQALLERSRAARTGHVLGVDAGGVPVPETARFQGLEVGRFEVSRAQLAAFRPGPPLDRSEGDLPATGVSFEDARAYAAWLARRTGRAFRLPTLEEARHLSAEAGTGGNTLDRWAGYPVNPDDSKRLAELVGRLPGDASLLLPVGSLPAAGDSLVFDLDGNAAEWAVGPDGRGVAVGPSADRPSDERAEALPAGVAAAIAPAGSDYTGFRVVVGPTAPEARNFEEGGDGRAPRAEPRAPREHPDAAPAAPAAPTAPSPSRPEVAPPAPGAPAPPAPEPESPGKPRG